MHEFEYNDQDGKGPNGTLFKQILQEKKEYFTGDQAVDLNNPFQFIVAQSIVKPIFKITKNKTQAKVNQEYKIRKQRRQLSEEEIKKQQQLEQLQKQKYKLKSLKDSMYEQHYRNIETDIFGKITFN